MGKFIDTQFPLPGKFILDSHVLLFNIPWDTK